MANKDYIALPYFTLPYLTSVIHSTFIISTINDLNSDNYSTVSLKEGLTDRWIQVDRLADL